MKTTAEIETAVFDALLSVAPEADPKALDRKRPIREQLDIDSMDFLNFIIAVHRTLGVDVPERDYAKLATLETAIAYLQERAQ